jgi:hypothetical protein
MGLASPCIVPEIMRIRWLSLSLLLVGCTAREAQRPEVRPVLPEVRSVSPELPSLPPVRVPSSLANAALPAGSCAFGAYLSSDEACKDVPTPRFAVLLAATANAHSAEEARARGLDLGLAVGYPFVLASNEMPWKGAEPGVFAVVAGLFAERATAAAFHRALASAQLVEIVSEEALAALNVWDGNRPNVVEVIESTPAYAQEDVERVEHALDEMLARKWVDLAAQNKRREAALAKLAPRCTIENGRLFMTTAGELQHFHSPYAPTRCPDGSRAWVRWRTTRGQSVVTRGEAGAIIHQLVLVECDHPTIERRRFGASSTDPPLRISSRGGGC